MKAASTFTTEHVVTTVCPLDCPDSCSLEVTVQDGRITTIDGSHENPVTGGYICAKVRKLLRARLRPRPAAVSRGPQGTQGMGNLRAH